MQVHERVRDAEKVSVIQGGRGGGEGSFLINREGYAGVKRQLWGEKKKECSIKVEEVERFCEIFFLLK